MSLELDFNLCSCCSTDFNFREATGIFSDSNLGGWGGSNPATDNALTAVLTIQFPDAVTLLPTGNTASINMLTRGFPRTDNVETVISPTNAGLPANSQFQDGIYYFVYTVTGVFNSLDFTATQGIYFLRDCDTRCCLEKKYASSKCRCNSKIMEKLFDAFLALDNAEFAAECGDLNRAVELYNYAKNICDNDCKC